MAGKRRGRNQNGDFKGFIEYRFEDSEKATFKKFVQDTAAVDSLIVKTVEADYRLTVAYDDYNEAYQCSVSTKDDSNTNAGYILVGRGADWFTAVAQAVFKHWHVMAGDWSKFSRQRTNDWD